MDYLSKFYLFQDIQFYIVSSFNILSYIKIEFTQFWWLIWN